MHGHSLSPLTFDVQSATSTSTIKTEDMEKQIMIVPPPKAREVIDLSRDQPEWPAVDADSDIQEIEPSETYSDADDEDEDMQDVDKDDEIFGPIVDWNRSFKVRSSVNSSSLKT